MGKRLFQILATGFVFYFSPLCIRFSIWVRDNHLAVAVKVLIRYEPSVSTLSAGLLSRAG
jgi:hypothetical protein